MNKYQTALRSLTLAYVAIEKLYARQEFIVKGMSKTRMRSAKGLEFAPIPRSLLTVELLTFQRRAQTIGVELEYELIKLVGTVPPHFHRRSGGAIVKCDATIIGTSGILDYLGTYPRKILWQPIKPGDIKFVPAGMIHGLKYNDGTVHEDIWSQPAYFLSVNTPRLAVDDTVYV